MEKRFMFVFILPILIFILVFFIIFIIFTSNQESLTCGDGTLYGECSLRKPYFCENGELIERASVCGCSNISVQQEDLCISKYQTSPKNITLNYVLRGEEKEIDFVVYQGMVEYLAGLPVSIDSSDGEQISRQDFKLRNINEEEQRELLLPLVTKIQNIAEDKSDQIRIAVSLIQKIPFGSSERIITIGPNLETNYTRYPYEVLYEMQGVCGERADLLAFLLKELGYDVVLFYYNPENHEALGIKCPVEYSLKNTEYCFVETSGPSILSNDQLEYVGGIKLYSDPELIMISGGDSLPDNLYEYKDAKWLIKINKIIEEKGRVNWLYYIKLKKLREKYGLIDYYRI